MESITLPTNVSLENSRFYSQDSSQPVEMPVGQPPDVRLACMAGLRVLDLLNTEVGDNYGEARFFVDRAGSADNLKQFEAVVNNQYGPMVTLLVKEEAKSQMVDIDIADEGIKESLSEWANSPVADGAAVQSTDDAVRSAESTLANGVYFGQPGNTDISSGAKDKVKKKGRLDDNGWRRRPNDNPRGPKSKTRYHKAD